MVMVDDVVALLRPQHDRYHVMADERADLLRLLLSQAFAFFLDLAHAYSDLGGSQAFDRDRLQNRLAHVTHGFPPGNSKLGLKSSSVFPFASVNRCPGPAVVSLASDERKSSSSLPPWIMGMIAAPWPSALCHLQAQHARVGPLASREAC